MIIRDLSFRGLRNVSWALMMLAFLGGCQGPTRSVSLAIGLVGVLVWLALTYRQRWRPAPIDTLARARVERATYAGTGGVLVVRRANGQAQRTGWRDADEMASAVRAAGAEPQAQRFELGTVSMTALIMGILAVTGAYGGLAIFALPARFPPLLAWPWLALLMLGCLPVLLGVVWVLATSAELGPGEVLRVRIGPWSRNLARGDVQDMSIIEGAVVVRLQDGTSIRVPMTAEVPARRLVRSMGGG